jgi:hypothetical protein
MVGGEPDEIVMVSVETVFTTAISDPSSIITGFRDFSGYDLGWRYIMKVTGTPGVPGAPATQYLIYDGNDDPVANAERGGSWIPWTVLSYTESSSGGVEIWEEASVQKLSLVNGVTYTTQIYIAGIAGVVGDGSRFMMSGETIHLESDVVITPVWVEGRPSDPTNTLTPGKTGSTDVPGNVRMISLVDGSDLVLPKNQYGEQTGYKFVGWRYTNGNNMIYPSWYTFEDYAGGTIFEATWLADGNSALKQLSFDGNGSDGTVGNYSLYMGVGKTYYSFVLPMNEFTKTGHKFIGWACSDDGYVKIYQPFDEYVATNATTVTFKAQWATKESDDHVVTLDGDVNHSEHIYFVYTDDSYVLPNNMFGPEYERSDGKSWEFIGWNVKLGNKVGATVPLSAVKPGGTDDYIINDGTIKFVYYKDD